MRNLLAFMLLAVSLVIASPVYANAVDVSGLTQDQIRSLQTQAEALRTQTNKSDVDQTLDSVQKYVEVGKGIGAGLGEAARSLNIAVNEFAVSPVGKWTLVLITYKVVGQDIIGLVMGLLWFAVFIPLWAYYFKRICLYQSITEEMNNGKVVKRHYQGYSPKDDHVLGYRIGFCIVMAIICIAGLGMIL